MKRSTFRKIVTDALQELPQCFKDKIENVAVIIEDTPTPEDIDQRENLLGLYQGIPLADRTHFYSLVLPDKITIFQKDIERACRNEAQIKELVRDTIRHELAHHFGISDERLTEIGGY